MKSRFIKHTARVLLLMFVAVTFTPKKTSANPVAIPLVVGGKAFVTVLGGPYVIAAAGIIAVGALAYHYYYDGQAARKVEFVSPPSKGAPPNPPSKKTPWGWPTVVAAQTVKSAYDIQKRLKKGINEQQTKAPMEQSGVSSSSAEDSGAKTDPQEEKTEHHNRSVFGYDTPPPDINYHIERFINPSEIARAFDSRKYEYQYRHENRYGADSEWGIFNPDFVSRWKSDAHAQSERDAMVKQAKAATDSIRNADLGEGFEARLKRLQAIPSGYSDSQIFANLNAIEAAYQSFDYDQMIDQIYKLKELIREFSRDEQNATLVKYWQDQLSARYVNESGILHDLPVSRHPLATLANGTHESSLAARSINHLQLVSKKVEGAWAFEANRDHLNDLSTEVNLQRIESSANAIQNFKTINDLLTAEWIKFGNGRMSASQKLLDEMVVSVVKLGNDLERGEGNLDKKLSAWVEENGVKLVPGIFEGDLFEYLKQRQNWRELSETINGDENFEGTFDGWALSAQGAGESIDPPAPSNRETDDDKPIEKDADNFVDRKTRQKILDEVLEEHRGQAFRDSYGHLFELEDAKLSEDVNEADLRENPDYEISHKPFSIVLFVRSLEKIRLLRGYSTTSFIYKDRQYFAPLSEVVRFDGQLVNAEEWKSLFSMDDKPLRAVLVEFDIGSRFLMSLTSDSLNGAGNQPQFKANGIEDSAVRVLQDTVLE